jgi:glutamate/tyrosine decarboxylase-like PLP-dependent enzyme
MRTSGFPFRWVQACFSAVTNLWLSTLSGIQTGYMPARSEAPDPYRTTTQWSRRCIGLKVFCALAHLGASGYASVIEHQADMADQLREELTAAGWTIVNQTPLPLVLFSHPLIEEGATTVSAVAGAVQANRHAWISEAILSTGQRYLRACITNHRTQPEHVRFLVDQCEKCLSRLTAKAGS